MTPIDASALDQALAGAGDGVCVVDGTGHILLWNRAAERILGYTAREALGRHCGDVFVGRDAHGNRLYHPGCHVMTLCRLAEPVQHFDMLAWAKGGRTVWLDTSVIAIPTTERANSGRHGNMGTAAGKGPGSNAHSNGFILMHLFRDVTSTRELLELVRERFAAPPATEGDGVGTLTRCELEVLRLIAEGGNTRSVAEKLHVSSATVRHHVQNLLSKLSAHSRLEAVAYAHRHRLL
jgi:PAS domain S-box-containing protein